MGKRTKKASNLNVSIAAFDSPRGVRPIYTGVPIEEARTIGYDDYLPTGGTPLNDSVAWFIGDLDAHEDADPDSLHVGVLIDESYSMSHLRDSVIEGINTFLEEVKADKSSGGEPGVMVVIMTDGEENSSVEDPTGDKIRKLIAAKEDEGWNFAYLGANQDAWAVGNSFGLGAHSHSLTYDHNAAGIQMAMGSAALLTNTRKSTTRSVYETTADTIGTRNDS